jgi:pimeloyl-ACP methyl ester carboxylesterase
VPIYMPNDPAIPAKGVPARASFERPFIRDKQILQREAKQGTGSLPLLGYAIVLAITLSIIALNAWALVRLATVIGPQARPPARRTTPVREPLAGVTSLERRELRLHGHPVAYYTAGSGPVLLLIHGITSSADAWREVVPALAEHYTGRRPDLLGHGGSAKPRGTTRSGAYASGLRDLLAALGHERATVVGHSMGGGIAMQLAYQFPERVERTGARRERRARQGGRLGPARATLPGAEWVLPVLTRGRPRAVLGAGQPGAEPGRAAHPRRRPRHRARARVSERRTGAAGAFLHTGALDHRSVGQRVSATDRLYLAESMPTLIVWGERDPMIPARTGDRRARPHPPLPAGALPGRRPLPVRRGPRALRARFARLHRGQSGGRVRRGDDAPAAARGSGGVNLPEELTPRLRGVSHAWAMWFAVVACVVLAIYAPDGARARGRARLRHRDVRAVRGQRALSPLALEPALAAAAAPHRPLRRSSSSSPPATRRWRCSCCRARSRWSCSSASGRARWAASP